MCAVTLRLTPAGRLRLLSADRRPVGRSRMRLRHLGISGDHAHVWWRRYQADGICGAGGWLRAARTALPHRTKASRERRILHLSRKRRARAGPHRGHRGDAGVDGALRCLPVIGMNRLDHLDRVTRQPRAPDRDAPAGRTRAHRHQETRSYSGPGGSQWRIHGRSGPGRYAMVTAAGPGWVTRSCTPPSMGYSRLAYSEVLNDEQGATTAAFRRRAETFFAAHNMHVDRVLTDNGACYRSQRVRPPRSATSSIPEPAPTGPPPTAKLNG